MITRRSVLGAVLATPTLAKTAAQSAAAPLLVNATHGGVLDQNQVVGDVQREKIGRAHV